MREGILEGQGRRPSRRQLLFLLGALPAHLKARVLALDIPSEPDSKSGSVGRVWIDEEGFDYPPPAPLPDESDVNAAAVPSDARTWRLTRKPIFELMREGGEGGCVEKMGERRHWGSLEDRLRIVAAETLYNTHRFSLSSDFDMATN